MSALRTRWRSGPFPLPTVSVVSSETYVLEEPPGTGLRFLRLSSHRGIPYILGSQGLGGLGEGQGEQGLHSGEELANPCRVQLISWFLAWAGRQSMAVGIQAVCATQSPGSAGDLVTRVGGGGRGHPLPLCSNSRLPHP